MTVTALPPPVEADEARDAHVLVARYRKARKLADHLAAFVQAVNAEAAAESVAVLGRTEVGRALAAKAAGVNDPSPTTWALVVELVRERGEGRPR